MPIYLLYIQWFFSSPAMVWQKIQEPPTSKYNNYFNPFQQERILKLQSISANLLDRFIVVFCFFLVKMSTNNPSQKLVVLESSVKPSHWQPSKHGVMDHPALAHNIRNVYRVAWFDRRFKNHWQVRLITTYIYIYPTCILDFPPQYNV